MGADGVRLAYPLLQAGGGGSTPTSALQLFFRTVDLATAKALNRLWHSRLPCVTSRGCRWACAAEHAGVFYAAAIWVRPIARCLPQYAWLELSRMAVAPDAPRNTASRMLGWMAREVRARFPGVGRLISYQDVEVHTGGIYRAAGWTPVPQRGGAKPRWGTHPRHTAVPVMSSKVRWEKVLTPGGGTVEIDSPAPGHRPEPTLFPL